MVTEAADSLLSQLEECCVNLLFDGLTDAEIAARLGTSEGTVGQTLRRAGTKLGIPPGKRGWFYAARRLHLHRCPRCSNVR
jgi:DNA-directed RNA polymerase specialized sigma24 family protein